MASDATGTGVLVMQLPDELDAETAPAARDEGAEALALPWVKHLVVDLSAVTFVGSSGLGVLVDLCRQAKAAGIEFSLDHVPSKVHRVIEISGLAGSFAIGHID